MTDRVVKSDEEWKKQLTPEQFEVTRRKGTERAFTGATWNSHEKGVYQCVCCGIDLYLSDHKYAHFRNRALTEESARYDWRRDLIRCRLTYGHPI